MNGVATANRGTAGKPPRRRDLAGCAPALHPRGNLPAVRVLIVSVDHESHQVIRELRVGAHGYRLDRLDSEHLLQSISQVMEGGAPLPGELPRQVVEDLCRLPLPAGAEVRLSPREGEVLSWVAHGYSNKEIGARLGISIHTVGVHLTNIYNKLQVRSRTEAAAWYFSGSHPGSRRRRVPERAGPALRCAG